MDGGASFFEELQPQSVPVTPHKPPDVSPRPSHTAASEPPEGEAGESEEAILRALYVGNYHAALDACLQVCGPFFLFCYGPFDMSSPK